MNDIANIVAEDFDYETCMKIVIYLDNSDEDFIKSLIREISQREYWLKHIENKNYDFFKECVEKKRYIYVGLMAPDIYNGTRYSLWKEIKEDNPRMLRLLLDDRFLVSACEHCIIKNFPKCLDIIIDRSCHEIPDYSFKQACKIGSIEMVMILLKREISGIIAPLTWSAAYPELVKYLLTIFSPKILRIF